MRGGHTRLRDGYDLLRNHVDDLLNGGTIDLEGLQVAGVDTDNRGSRIERAQCLQTRMGFDESFHAKRARAFQERDEHVLFERCDD